MRTVRVGTQWLLERLRDNRSNHRANFEKALGVYRTEAIEELERSLREAREGKPIRRYVAIPQPEDHTEDYDLVIAMLEASADEHVELQSHEFQTYALDKWGWIESFGTNTMSYANKAPPKFNG